MGLKALSQPEIEPLSLAEVKEFLRLDDDDASQDNSIEALIRAGRERCEMVANRALIKRQYLLTLPRFPNFDGDDPNQDTGNSILGSLGGIRLSNGPVAWDVLVDSVKYIDVSSGTLTTIDPANYLIDDSSEAPMIRPAYATWWPIARRQYNGVQVTYTAGYGTTQDSVPMEIRERIKNYVAYCFEHRTDRDEGFLDSLFQGFWCGAY